MLQSSRQLGNNCWETQACGYRGRGAGSQTAPQASWRPPLGEEEAGTSCRPNVPARAAWQGPMAQTHTDLLWQETHFSPSRSGSRDKSCNARRDVGPCHLVTHCCPRHPGSIVPSSTKNHRTVLTAVSSKTKGSW